MFKTSDGLSFLGGALWHVQTRALGAVEIYYSSSVLLIKVVSFILPPFL